MSVAEDVIAALDPLRAHKARLPDKRTLPAIVVSIVAGHDEWTLEGDDNLSHRIVQLDAWASTETGADNYMRQAREKMLASADFTVSGVDVSGAPDYDDDANLYRSSFEFRIWLETSSG